MQSETKQNWLRVAVISDTHMIHHEITKDLLLKTGGDLIIHSGDFLNYGTTEELHDFCKWFSSLPFESKIFIAGNHDFRFDMDYENSKKIVDSYPSIYYLQDSGVELSFKSDKNLRIKIWGSPWSPAPLTPTQWAFCLPDDGEEMKSKMSMIPSTGLDILVTHTPPHGVLDVNTWHKDDLPLGSNPLWKKILNVKPKICVFGHIHQSYGHEEISYSIAKKTHFFNASLTYLYDDKKRYP